MQMVNTVIDIKNKRVLGSNFATSGLRYICIIRADCDKTIGTDGTYGL